MSQNFWAIITAVQHKVSYPTFVDGIVQKCQRHNLGQFIVSRIRYVPRRFSCNKYTKTLHSNTLQHVTYPHQFSKQLYDMLCITPLGPCMWCLFSLQRWRTHMPACLFCGARRNRDWEPIYTLTLCKYELNKKCLCAGTIHRSKIKVDTHRLKKVLLLLIYDIVIHRVYSAITYSVTAWIITQNTHVEIYLLL